MLKYWKQNEFVWITGLGLVLAALIALSGLGLPGLVWAPLGMLRLVLGFLLVFVGPGYALQAALFSSRDDLDGVERIGLSVGLSIALVSVVALALDYTPWGLTLWSIFWGEFISLLLFALIATWRRVRLEPEQADTLRVGWQPRAWWQSISRAERRIGVLSAVGFLIALSAVVWLFLAPSPDEYLTEFYILGKGGLAENYPREALVGEPVQVTGGIINREGKPARYTIRVLLEDGREIGSPVSVELADGQTWQGPLVFTFPEAGEDQQVLFHLERDHSAGVYRLLKIWLNVKQQQ